MNLAYNSIALVLHFYFVERESNDFLFTRNVKKKGQNFKQISRVSK